MVHSTPSDKPLPQLLRWETEISGRRWNARTEFGEYTICAGTREQPSHVLRLNGEQVMTFPYRDEDEHRIRMLRTAHNFAEQHLANAREVWACYDAQGEGER